MEVRKDRIVELTLEEALGKAPPDLTNQVMAALDAPVARQAPPPRLSIYWPWAAAAAALLIIGVALLMKLGGEPVQPQDNEIISRPDTKDLQRAKGDEITRTPWRDPHDAAPREQPSSSGHLDKPESQPREAPTAQPDGTEGGKGMIEQPAPPSPARPAPDKPALPPEAPAPGPSVDKPKEPDTQPAEQRNPTEATTQQPVVAATVVYIPEGAKLQYTAASGAEVDVKANIELMTGWVLKTRDPVALDFEGGIRVWFDGETRLGKEGAEFVLSVLKGSIYVDALLSRSSLSVRRGDLAIKVANAVLLAETFSNTNLKVACLEGDIAWGESVLASGQRAILSGHGFARERTEGARLRDERMLQFIARAQNQWREDFEIRGGQNVFAGEVEGGRVLGAAREPSVGLHLVGGHTPRKDATLRLRIKSSAKGAVALQLLGDEKGAKFHRDVALEAGQWTIVSLPVKLGGEGGEAVTFTRFQAQAKQKGAQIEIDWIEINEKP